MSETELQLPGGQVTLVPGELRAYRRWRLGGHVKDGPRLQSVTFPVCLDPAQGPVFKAVCGNFTFDFWGQYPRRVPAKCTCGFYAVYDGGIRRLLYEYGASSPDLFDDSRDPWLMGSVALSGRVVLGSTGIARAERMRVEALCAPVAVGSYTVYRKVKACARLYDVPFTDNIEEFQDQYPLSPAPSPSSTLRKQINLEIAQMSSRQLNASQEWFKQNHRVRTAWTDFLKQITGQ